MASGPHDNSSKQPLRQVYARLRKEFTAADLQKYAEEDNWIPAEQWIAELQALHDKLVKSENFEEGSSHGDPKKQQQTKTKGWRGFAGRLRSVPQGLQKYAVIEQGFPLEKLIVELEAIHKRVTRKKK